jgi:hypothetical protein
MSPDDQLSEPSPTLVQELQDGNVVGVIGSGLSCAAGLPGWVELIRGLCDEAWDTKASKRQDIVRAWQLSEDRPLSATDLLKHRVLGAEFAACLGRQILYRRTFECEPKALQQAVKGQTGAKPWRVTQSPSAVTPWPTSSHRLLMRLGLRCVVTTNFDPLLELADRDVLSASWSSADVPDHLAAKRPLILKIHGDLNHPTDLIATRTDYTGPYHTSATRTALAALFRTSRLLWIGYGHNDPDLDLLLDDMARLGISGGHAIVSEITPELEQRLETAKVAITALPLHADMPRVLQRLALAVARPVAFTIRFSSACMDDRACKKRSQNLEAMLESYGVKADVWAARRGNTDWQLEALPSDYRGLRDLLARQDASLFAKLAAQGVRACDLVDIPESTPDAPAPSGPAQLVTVTTDARVEFRGPSPATTPAPTYVPRGHPEVAVSELLVELFSPEELRAFVLGFAAEVQHDISFTDVPRHVALYVAQAFGRRGLIQPSLIAALRGARPGRASMVDALACHLFPWDHGYGESYELFCRLLDREQAWQRIARTCENAGPALFLIHGTPHQHIALFMDRVHRYLDDEDEDGVDRQHQACEVAFERDLDRARLPEEWEACFRRAMNFNRGSLEEHLRKVLAHDAIIFLVRSKGSAPLADLDDDEIAGLTAFLGERLPAVIAALDPSCRAVRVLLGVEHATSHPAADALCNALRGALALARGKGLETHVLELHFPGLGDTIPSVQRFMGRQIPGYTDLPEELRRQVAAVHREHEARDTRNYRDLAADLYVVLRPFLPPPRPPRR